MQRRLCRFKKSPEVQWNWDVQSKNCPKTVFCPGAKKNKWIISPGNFSTVSVHSLSLSWQMSVRDSISLSASAAFPSASSRISLSLSLRLLLTLLLSSEAWLTWERMSSLRQLSGLASGRVEKRKRENFKGLRAVSQRIVRWAWAGWAQPVSY